MFKNYDDLNNSILLSQMVYYLIYFNIMNCISIITDNKSCIQIHLANWKTFCIKL